MNRASNWAGGTGMGLHHGVRDLATILALASLPTAGCSWIFVNKPPPDPVPVTPSLVCTTSVASPVIDTVLAAAALGTGIAAIAMSSKSSGSCTGYPCFDFSDLNTAGMVAGVVLAATAVPLACSAGYGYSTTAECRELKDAQLACVSGVEASCKGLMKTAQDECEKSSQAACTSSGDASPICYEGKGKACMETAGWTQK